jgi:putative thioredoxin
MKAFDDIVDVTEADFEYQVIEYSHQAPVVVDFWAEWCGPCKLLGPMLERLAKEAKGAFRLAKINVDENPNLAIRYQVRGIPNVKAFRNGQVVAEFTGAQPEARVRQFIQEVAPGETGLALEKAQSLLNLRHWGEAEKEFRKVLEAKPQQPAASLGLMKSLVMLGKTQEAEQILRNFPSGKEFASAENLRPLLTALNWAKSNEPEPENDELAPAYRNALRLILRGNLLAAMDGILDVLRQDKHYRNEEARLVMIGLLELLDSEESLARDYRNEFAQVLF